MPVRLTLAATATVLAALVALPASAPAQGSAPFIRVLAERTHVPRVTEKKVTVPLAVALQASVPGSTVVLQLADVRPEAGTVEPRSGAFTIGAGKRLTADGGAAPAILLEIDTHLATPGTYTVVVGARRTGRRQIVRLRYAVQLPAPVVTASAIQASKVTQGDDTIAAFSIRETTGKSHVTDLRFVQSSQQGEGIVGGRVVVDPIERLAPGRALEVEPRLDGDFPLGTASGTLQLDSRELSQPVQIAFQLETRRSPLWLLGLLILGVALGWLTRVALRRRIETTEGRLRLDDVRLRALRLRDRHADAKLKRELQQIAKDAERDRDNIRKTEELAAAATKWETALVDAVAGLATRLTQQRERLEGHAALLGPVTLPGAAGPRLAALRADVRIAAERLDRENAETARKALNAADASWNDTILPALQDWRSAAAELASAVTEQSVTAAAAEPAGAASTELAAMEEAEADPTPSAVVPTLAPARRAVDAMRTAAVNAAKETTDGVLAAAKGPRGDATRLRNAYNAFKEVLNAATGADPAAYRTAAQAMRELEAAAERLIRAAAPDAQQEAVEAEIEAGNLVGAAQATSAPADVGTEGLESIADEVEAAVETGTQSLAPEDTGGSVFLGLPATRGPSAGSARWRASALRRLGAMDRIRTFLLAVVAVLLGYLLLVDEFVGTTGDLLAAFAFGYTANLSVGWIEEKLPQRGATPAQQQQVEEQEDDDQQQVVVEDEEDQQEEEPQEDEQQPVVVADEEDEAERPR